MVGTGPEVEREKEDPPSYLSPCCPSCNHNEAIGVTLGDTAQKEVGKEDGSGGRLGLHGIPLHSARFSKEKEKRPALTAYTTTSPDSREHGWQGSWGRRAMSSILWQLLLESRLPKINNLRYADDTILLAESEEEVKSLLMKMKEDSEKAVLKLNIQKKKIMASGLITS